MFLAEGTYLQGGKYKIVRHISSGGFGNTYEGVHTMMDTRVAIKESFPKMFCNRDENTSHVTVATQGNRELVDKLRKKFNEEAKAVFQMNHPNIVRVLDIFEENGTAYYVMEYVDGKSLNDITKERGALPETEAVGYIRQVADALRYVHSLNRLHLDIKPGNIMVDKNGKAILIDFGASKHYDDESGENTSTLMGVNTKGYAPIEQSTQSFTSFSPATDIYALGATLYRLLSGTVPPDANLLLAEEETLQPLPSAVSTATCNAVNAAMSLRRKDRPQSVDEFMALLDKASKASSDKKFSKGTAHVKVSEKRINVSANESTLLNIDDKSSNDAKEHSSTAKLSNWFGWEEVNILLDMTGYKYSTNECIQALQERKGDIQEAIAYLQLQESTDKSDVIIKKKVVYHATFKEKMSDLWFYIKEGGGLGATFLFVLTNIFCVILLPFISRKFSIWIELSRYVNKYYPIIIILSIVLGFILGLLLFVILSWDEIQHPEKYHPERCKEI